MERTRVTLGRTKKNTLRKINATGKTWSPDLQMPVMCTPEAMEQMGIVPQEPETEGQRQQFTELIRLDMHRYRLSPEWVEWLMGFPHGWTDTGCGTGSRTESAG